jgi:autotransporter family porin
LRRRKRFPWELLLAFALPFLIAAAGTSAVSVRQARGAAFVHPGTTLVKPRPGMYFRTLPPGARLPRQDARCAKLVTRRRWEPRPDNVAANHTVVSGLVHWPMTEAQLHWRRWIAKRSRVTGRYTGRTDEIIRWAACKWGLDENVLRAVAVKESGWHQNFVGDAGASFGLMQIKDHYGNGTLDLGGFPWTQLSTALAADFYSTWIRSCLDGDFYDGGPWLYGGKRVRGDLWGCVGAWYSGEWYSGGAVAYISDVKRYLANRAWRHLGT